MTVATGMGGGFLRLQQVENNEDSDDIES